MTVRVPAAIAPTPAHAPSMLSIRLNAFVSPISQRTVRTESTVSHGVHARRTPAASAADARTTCRVSLVTGRKVSRSSSSPIANAPALPAAIAMRCCDQAGTSATPAAVPAKTATPPSSAVGDWCQRSERGAAT